MFLYGLLVLTFVSMYVVACTDLLYTFNDWLKVDKKREYFLYLAYVVLMIIALILEVNFGG